MAILGWPYRWNPFRDMSSIQRQVEDLMSQREGALGWLSHGRDYPSVNVFSRGDALVVCAELPGMERDEIDLTITGNTIAIKGERKSEELPDDARYHRQERRTGAFVRAVQLPERVDAENVRAQYTSGVLVVTLPRVEEAGPRKITLT